MEHVFRLNIRIEGPEALEARLSAPNSDARTLAACSDDERKLAPRTAPHRAEFVTDARPPRAQRGPLRDGVAVTVPRTLLPFEEQSCPVDCRQVGRPWPGPRPHRKILNVEARPRAPLGLRAGPRTLCQRPSHATGPSQAAEGRSSAGRRTGEARDPRSTVPPRRSLSTGKSCSVQLDGQMSAFQGSGGCPDGLLPCRRHRRLDSCLCGKAALVGAERVCGLLDAAVRIANSATNVAAALVINTSGVEGNGARSPTTH
jgi:hypothetical protein